MTSPPRADAPVLRFGKPYHEIARLAGDIRPFLAMDAALRQQGVSAPEVYAADAEHGIAIIEDLGSEPFVEEGGPIPERYLEAVALLARLHATALPASVPQGDGAYSIPPLRPRRAPGRGRARRRLVRAQRRQDRDPGERAQRLHVHLHAALRRGGGAATRPGRCATCIPPTSSGWKGATGWRGSA